MKTRIFSSLFLPLFLTSLTLLTQSSAFAQIPSSGLVGYWPFTGNANDESGNGNNGTVNGATLTTDRFGNANSAYNFDGVNDFIQYSSGSATSLNVLGDFSISFWLKTSSTGSSARTIISFGDQLNNNSGGVTIGINDGITQAPYGRLGYATQGQWRQSTNTINDNAWHFVVITLEGSVFTLYIDNVLNNQSTNQLPTLSWNGSRRIGAGNYAMIGFYKDLLDDIGMYNRALTPAEITQLYTDQTSLVEVPCTPFLGEDQTVCAGTSVTLSASGSSLACPTLPSILQTGLVGYWPFCGNANDASGNGNNGTVNGATLTTDRFGNANSAYSFDGVNDFIQCPSTISTLNIATISGWAFCNSLFGGQFVQIGEDNNTNCNGIGVGKGGFNPLPGIGGGLNFWNLFQGNKLISLSSCVNYYDSGYTLTNGIWFHYAMVKQNNLFLYYINGSLVGTSTILPAINPTNKIFIGCSGSGVPPNVNTFFSGQLDEVAIHNRALTATEIQQLFTLGQTTYLWSNGATTPTINVSPTSTTTYTCTVTTNGVSCTDSVTVVVSNPVIDLGADVTVCGTSTTLTAPSGYDSYLWSNGGTTNTTTVSANGTYSCTVTQGGCSASDSVDVTLIDATITASDSIICAGETVTLSVPQGGSLSTACAALPTNLQTGLVGYWPFCGNANDASGNGNNGTVNGATLTTDRFGNVNSAYSFDGVNDYIQTNFHGVQGGASRSVSFWAKTSVNSASGGLNQDNMNVLCYGGPGNGGNFEVALNHGCEGLTLDINNGVNTKATTVNNDTWNYFTIVFNSSNGNNFNSVSYYKNSVLLASTCQIGTLTAVNTVNNFPIVLGAYWDHINRFFQGKLDDIGIYNRVLTQAEIQQLYNFSQTTYLWSNGATTPTINVSPTSTTTYTCTVTTNGVSCTDTITVVVGNPVASITPNGIVEICQGQSIALTANGGVSYLWNTVAPTQSITVNTEAVYTVTVTDANGCTDTESQLVKVNFLPNIGVNNASICSGQSTTLTATGGLSYVWSPANGLSSTTGTTVTASPSTSAVYTVTGTGANGCTNTATAAVTLNAPPVASITPNGMVEICEGESIALTANGGVSYLWNTGAPTQSITVNTEAFYTVTVTDENGCTDTESQLVKVNFLPNIGVNNASICSGQSATLTATGGLSYEWSPATGLSSTTGTAVTASPSTSTAYTVTGTGANGCTNTATAAVTVNALPAATITPATATTFCQGGGVVLNANTGAGLSYQWFNNAVAISGETSSTYIANESGSYTVIVTNTTTCSSTSNSIDVTTVANVNYFADADGDGFGDAATLVSTCVQPQGYVTGNTDCDDNDSSVNTAATEVCNHIDDDCSGTIDDGLVFETYYADNDGDTYGDANNSIYECSQPDGFVSSNTDCDDNNANQNAASAEICNGEDDDCDGAIDNGLIFLDFFTDIDGDGFGAGDVISSCTDLGSGYTTNNTDCDDTNSGVYPGAEELCNSIDDNCDGQTDDGTLTVYFIDNDGDTYGNPSVSILACVQPIGYTPDDNDCNDTDANINPGAEDIGGNGIDENCDGQIDNSIYELNSTIALYPNPAHSELNIQVNSSVIGSNLYIFDAVGKIVYKQQLLSTQTILPVSNFADGNYVVRVGEMVKRFVVQK